MAELSKEVLAEIGQLALKLRHNPKTKREFTKLVKQVAPEISFPDADVEDLREEFNAQREKDKEDRANEQLRQALADSRAKIAANYDENQIKEIEDVMVKKGLASYEDAAVLYAHQQPVVRPDPLRPQVSLELPTDDNWLKNPKKMALNSAYDVIQEFQRKRA
jgi:hypothetical protein